MGNINIPLSVISKNHPMSDKLFGNHRWNKQRGTAVEQLHSSKMFALATRTSENYHVGLAGVKHCGGTHAERLTDLCCKSATCPERTSQLHPKSVGPSS